MCGGICIHIWIQIPPISSADLKALEQFFKCFEIYKGLHLAYDVCQVRNLFRRALPRLSAITGKGFSLVATHIILLVKAHRAGVPNPWSEAWCQSMAVAGLGHGDRSPAPPHIFPWSTPTLMHRCPDHPQVCPAHPHMCECTPHPPTGPRFRKGWGPLT